MSGEGGVQKSLSDDAALLRQAVAVLRAHWPQSADGPPLADIIAHLRYRAKRLDNASKEEGMRHV